MEKIKILIVEDEAIMALDLAESLESAGYQALETVASGAAALAIYEKIKVDLVLMDIQIKGDLDGIDTAIQLQKIRPVPLIYLTGQTDAATVERAKISFPSAYLAKPFDEKNLFLAIELAMHNFVFHKIAQPPGKPTAEKPAAGALTADNILRTDKDVFIKQNYKFVKFNPDELLFLAVNAGFR